VSDFYRRLDERMLRERTARIFRDRPDSLHDYQGCVRDVEVCRCGHTRICHLPEGCDDGCPCVAFAKADGRPA